MSVKKQRIDAEYTRLLGNHMVNAKGFYDYGVKRGLTTPEALRLTVAKRKETAKALTDKGMSHRQVAKALGVTKATITRDVRGPERPNNGPKRPNKKNGQGKKVVPAVEEPEKPEEPELTATTLLQSLFEQADANGGVIYVEVSGYGVRVKRLTC